MITITKPKNALVVTTSPVRSSMATSLAKTMRACSAQLTRREGRAAGPDGDMGAHPIRVRGILGPRLHLGVWQSPGSFRGASPTRAQQDQHERTANRAHLRLQRGGLLEQNLPG